MIPSPTHTSNQDDIDKAFLTDVELAERWRMSPKTLRNLRVQGGHVPFIRIGRLVRYPR
ncbi:helix-turn-helix domain-containing protein [Lichenihabitans sp. Uapishka_5]|uniref:helix-turn-helix domain-containing protein n=1 Tax=Lichenihabitans sp. Uapishka_5 TaxID=3037302 RepID=UPI0029E821F9|nr:helix-turn-helix domain-containing protein [Lichenihabitans sp. Uapishka_5]MDX7953822.1 helix-turn-helix domain-containing protein [Lichenihabitans sp. Uapishka_5]